MQTNNNMRGYNLVLKALAGDTERKLMNDVGKIYSSHYLFDFVEL